MSVNEGGCLCGNLRYNVRSEPLRVTYCHCRFCQRATGSAYLVEPIFDKRDFQITTGEPKIYRQKSAGSGKQVFVHFCDNCGTKIHFSFERFPEIIGLFAGTFDDPNWYERSSENSKHIFLGVAQKGTVIPGGIETFVEHAMTNVGHPTEATVFSEPKTIGIE